PLNITNNYLEMWFNHGVNPTDASYEYVMLPNQTKQQVEEYAKNPSITVLSNTSSVQAVKENKLNMIGANFFTDTVQNIDFITANKKSSIMAKESADYLEISISDPTMKNNGTIEVELNKQIESVVSADSEVTVTQLGPTIKLSVNVNNSNGDTFKVKFKKI
ncbi:silent information regulator protein Sir2, partial [Clostridium perfringens]